VTHDGPPAITAYNNQLHFVGTNPTTHQLWHATMSPSEVFSSAQPMAGHFSASRVSTAAYGGRLYLVHRAGATDAIVYNSFDGTSWGADQFVPNGSGGAPITGPRPVIAAVNGYLHLAHRRPGSDQVWWTYFNGCAWASEVTIGNRTSTYDPSLAAGGPGLNLITTSDDTSLGDLRTRFVRLSQFHAPPAPRFPPLCNIVIHPI
jgi:hypothetical protein